jgi:Glycosyltransferase family 87
MVNVLSITVDTESVTPVDGALRTGDAGGGAGEAATQGPDHAHLDLPSRRVMAAWFGAFAVYAGLTILTGHADGIWAAWGCGGYAVTALLLLAPTGWVIPFAAAVGGALIAPLLWLITTYPPTGEVVVIGTSADYLLKHGTPYLPESLLTGWTSYNPYLPLMEVFGLPRSAGLTGVLGDPRIWTTLVTLVALAAAFAIVSPHPVNRCRSCRSRLAWVTALAMASPLIAFPLSVGVTDPPVIALTVLTLALASRGKLGWSALVLALACAMKTTAWAVIPVLAVMAWVQLAPRIAARFAATSIGATAILSLLTAPAALATPDAVQSVKQNLIDYPLGTTKYKTPAQSPLPGHLIAELGPVGRGIVLALMVLAVVAFVAWILLRPPRDIRDVTIRLAVGYAVMFTLDPSTRFGYYAYPLALLGWLALTRTKTTAENADQPQRPWPAPFARFRPRLAALLLPRSVFAAIAPAAGEL